MNKTSNTFGKRDHVNNIKCVNEINFLRLYIIFIFGEAYVYKHIQVYKRNVTLKNDIWFEHGRFIMIGSRLDFLLARMNR